MQKGKRKSNSQFSTILGTSQTVRTIRSLARLRPWGAPASRLLKLGGQSPYQEANYA
jgi:hypothetical protein